MPAIQAMRSDALALRGKEDVQEKIPSFYNSVNQALGQSVVAGQDAAEQLIEQRFQAANTVAAQLRQKVDGQGALAELTVGAGTKLISSALNTILMVLQKTTTTDLIEIASDIANFLIERQTLQLQWDAAAATYAQWTVQAGYAGNGDFFGNATNPATGAIEYSITQWMEAPTPASLQPNNGAYTAPPTANAGSTTINSIRMATQSGMSWLDGTTFSTVAYQANSTTQNIPGDMEAYQYQPRNWQGDLAFEFFDHDGNPNTAMVPANGTNPDLVNGGPNPIRRTLSTVGISIDTNANGEYGNPGSNSTSAADDDQGSLLYYSPSQGKWYIKNTVVVNVPAGATSYSVPHKSVTIASSGIDYQLHSKDSGQSYTGPPGDYNDSTSGVAGAPAGTGSYDWNLTRLDLRSNDNPSNPASPIDTFDYDFNRDGVVDDRDATGDADGDGTIVNGQFIDADPGPIVNLQYVPGNDGDDLLPKSFIPPRYVRATQSNAGSHTVDRPLITRAIFNNAMGGRGAIRYRDALTPRFTDRSSYSGSTLGVGGYETYYSWGSVGSITRIGQY